MQECTQCGNTVIETDKFCESCGYNLTIDKGRTIESEEVTEETQENQLSRTDRNQEKSKDKAQSLIGLGLIALSVMVFAGYLVLESDNNPLSQVVNSWLASLNF